MTSPLRLALMLALFLGPRVVEPHLLHAQPQQAAVPIAGELIARGDAAHASLDPSSALLHYEAAIAVDSANYAALWKASRELADLAEFEENPATQLELFRRAEHHARRAVIVRPDDAEAHFHLARALGRIALTMGARDRVKYAVAIRDEALTALRYDSLHPGALHVLGRWNAEVMRLSGVERFFAQRFLGGKVFGSASWENAERYLERAVELDPERLTHSLDLAEIYLDRGKNAKAREQLRRVIVGRTTEYNDPRLKSRAEALLKRIE